MRVGGNDRAREFFSTQPDIELDMPIEQKYDTRAAALYRDKIATEAAGKTWSEATASRSAREWKPSGSATAFDLSGGQTDFGDKARGARGNVGGSRSSAAQRSGNGRSMAEEEPVFGNGMTASEMKTSTADFFARKQAETAARIAAGDTKYQGIGSSGTSHSVRNDSGDLLADAMSSISAGWGAFASVTAKAAQVAVEKGSELSSNINTNYIAPAINKAQDGELFSQISESVTAAAAATSAAAKKLAATGGIKTGSRQRNRSSAETSDAFFDAFESGGTGKHQTATGRYKGVGGGRSGGAPGGSGADGWDDNWGEEEFQKPAPTKANRGRAVASKSRMKNKSADDDDGWGDSNW